MAATSIIWVLARLAFAGLAAWFVFNLVSSSETSSVQKRKGVRKKASITAIFSGILIGALAFFPTQTCGVLAILAVAVIILLQVRKPA